MNPGKPIRLGVMQVITDFLATEVCPDNGYHNDLRGTGEQQRVFRGRAEYFNSDPLPCVSVLEGLNPDVDAKSPQQDRPSVGGSWKQSNLWVLLVQGWVDDDRTNPTDPAYYLAADVQRALAKLAATRIGGVVESVRMEAPVVRPPDQEVSSKAYFWMRYVVRIVDDLAKPYPLE